jgi:VWFA-related protein
VFGLIVALAGAPSLTAGPRQQSQTPVFKGRIERVAVAATVRDKRGRPVTNLQSADFNLLDAGVPREILDFRTETTPVSIALLADFSGSMDVAEKRAATTAVVDHLLSWLTPEDQIGLYAFDQSLRELQPLDPAPGKIIEKMSSVRPYGKTRLFDAIAETGRRVVASGGPRRAVVAMTDGADNASLLTPGAVSELASAIDVPVYVIVVVSKLDVAERTVFDEPRLESLLSGQLGDLARWTGGEIFAAITPASTSIGVRQIVDELRQQYLIAFEPSTRPGWHPIKLQTRDKRLVVRARSGYLVPDGPDWP